jgi:hypothetical protein
LFENAGDVGAAKLVPVYSKLASILKEYVVILTAPYIAICVCKTLCGDTIGTVINMPFRSEPEKSLGYLIKLADLQAGVGDVLDVCAVPSQLNFSQQ